MRHQIVRDVCSGDYSYGTRFGGGHDGEVRGIRLWPIRGDEIRGDSGRMVVGRIRHLSGHDIDNGDRGAVVRHILISGFEKESDDIVHRCV